MKNLMLAVVAAATLMACSEEASQVEETVVEETVVDETTADTVELADDVVDGTSEEVKPEVE
jgi:hypothetical protein